MREKLQMRRMTFSAVSFPIKTGINFVGDIFNKSNKNSNAFALN